MSELHVQVPAGVTSVLLSIAQGPPPPPTEPEIAGIWTSREELAFRPMAGPAWQGLLKVANEQPVVPKLSDQDSPADVRTMARGLVWARTGEKRCRDEVVAACEAVVGTEAGARSLALGRGLIGYVIAADLVGYRSSVFADWLDAVRRAPTSGGPKDLIECHEKRPNNWGTHAGASRAAIAVYLDDLADLERCAQVFRGYLGDRSAYSGFVYGDLSWQAEPLHPVGCNPLGATKDGHPIGGVLPDDQRRAGGFTWPPPKENYAWEALQGALAQALILSRRGYAAWAWSDKALLRAVSWLHMEANYPAEGDDAWQPWLVNWAYGSGFPAPAVTVPGKNVGFTDWTHAVREPVV